MQGIRPRDLAETGPVPEIHGLTNSIVFHHRRPLRYPVTLGASILTCWAASIYHWSANCVERRDLL